MASWKKVLHESSPTGDFPSGVALANFGGGSGSTFLKKDGTWATPTDTDTVYTHPTSAGNKHIPSGGSSGQFLRYSSSGTATWATPSYTTNTDTTYSAGTGLSLSTTTFSLASGSALTNLGGGSGSTFLKKDGTWATPTDTDTTYSVGDGGLTQKNFTSTLKTKLDGVATSANNYGFTLSADGGDDVAVASGDLLNIEGSSTGGVSVSRSGTDIEISCTGTTYSAGTGMSLSGTTFNCTVSDTNTTYSAGSGLDLSSTTFSVEADLRDGITHIGTDSGDYIGWTLNTHTDFYVNGNNEFRMEADGDFHADGDVIAASTTVASDKRLKTDIVQLEGNLDNVMSLEPVRFDWKLKNKGEDIGLIAQDVQRIVPEVVKEVEAIGKTKKFLKDDTMLTVDYSKLVPVLVGAIQELKAEIDDLKRLK